MNTPWGWSQSTTHLIPDFTWHSTAGHGGLRVKPEGIKRLSSQAQAIGCPYAGSLWFEEDCAWAVPFLELLEQGVEPSKLNEAWERNHRSVDEAKAHVLACVSCWNLPYLEARGIAPDPQGKADYEAMHMPECPVQAIPSGGT